MGKAGREPDELLLRIVEWSDRLQRVLGDVNQEQFLSDELRQLAVAKCLESIGHIAGDLLKMHPDFAKAHPELELRNAYGMRNRLAHDYESSGLDVVWDTATLHAPAFAARCRLLLRQMGVDEP